MFHAGPSKQMNFFDTTSSGSSRPAGLRASDQDSMYGNAVMYDVNKILTIGGATQQDTVLASRDVHVITLNGFSQLPTVRKVASMAFRRAFATSVVLPDGDVIAFGGQEIPKIFTDDLAVLTPELWSIKTETWRLLGEHKFGRTYHSVALLLPDGRVFVGGGGLCNRNIYGCVPSTVFLCPSPVLGRTRPGMSVQTCLGGALCWRMAVSEDRTLVLTSSN